MCFWSATILDGAGLLLLINVNMSKLNFCLCYFSPVTSFLALRAQPPTCSSNWPAEAQPSTRTGSCQNGAWKKHRTRQATGRKRAWDLAVKWHGQYSFFPLQEREEWEQTCSLVLQNHPAPAANAFQFPKLLCLAFSTSAKLIQSLERLPYPGSFLPEWHSHLGAPWLAVGGKCPFLQNCIHPQLPAGRKKPFLFEA